jgi:hypothetical protein
MDNPRKAPYSKPILVPLATTLCFGKPTQNATETAFCYTSHNPTVHLPTHVKDNCTAGGKTWASAGVS